MPFRSEVRHSRSAAQPLRRRHKPDHVLLILSLLLMVIGLVVIYAISPGLSIQKHVSENYYVTKQLLAIFLGMIAFGIAASVPWYHWRRFVVPLAVVAIVATVIALLLPTSLDYPAHRWLRVAGFSLQSVELVKFAVLAGVATFLAGLSFETIQRDSSKVFKPLLMLLLVIGIVVAWRQQDLGSTGVLVVMMLMMGFVAGLPLKRVLSIGGIILIGTLLLISTSSYRRDRVLTFLHPQKDCLTSGYQACQALIAVGSGGLFGKGLAHSVQAYGYLPEAANDSIFAIFAEKFGFVGVTFLLCLFAAFFSRIKTTMERAPDEFSRLLVAGVLAWLSTQTIINIGAMVGLLPLKGITLPFISYGGTSIVFTAAAVGLVYQISRYTSYAGQSSGEGGQHDYRDMRRRERRPYYTQPRGRA